MDKTRHSPFSKLLLVAALTGASSAQARRAPHSARSVVRSAAGIAIVKVETIRKVEGVRIAVVAIERLIEGLADLKRFALVAQRLRSTDRSYAAAGERALLCVSQRLYTKRLRRIARKLWGELPLYLIARQGDGRLPLVERKKGTYLKVGHLKGIAWPAKTPRPAEIPLATFERLIREWLRPARSGKKAATSRAH